MAGNAPQSAMPLAVPSSADARTFVIIVYGLYMGALLCAGLSGIAGLVLAYIKRDDVRGTVWESHFDNAIHAFWVWLALSVVGLLTVWLVIGFFVLIAAYVYFAYRTIKGLVRAVDSRPY